MSDQQGCSLLITSPFNDQLVLRLKCSGSDADHDGVWITNILEGNGLAWTSNWFLSHVQQQSLASVYHSLIYGKDVRQIDIVDTDHSFRIEFRFDAISMAVAVTLEYSLWNLANSETVLSLRVKDSVVNLGDAQQFIACIVGMR